MPRNSSFVPLTPSRHITCSQGPRAGIGPDGVHACLHIYHANGNAGWLGIIKLFAKGAVYDKFRISAGSEFRLMMTRVIRIGLVWIHNWRDTVVFCRKFSAVMWLILLLAVYICNRDTLTFWVKKCRKPRGCGYIRGNWVWRTIGTDGNAKVNFLGFPKFLIPSRVHRKSLIDTRNITYLFS